MLVYRCCICEHSECILILGKKNLVKTYKVNVSYEIVVHGALQEH